MLQIKECYKIKIVTNKGYNIKSVLILMFVKIEGFTRYPVSMYVCIYVCLCACMCMCLFVYVCMYLCVYVCVCVFYVCMYVCVYMYLYMCVCVCVCMYVCVFMMEKYGTVTYSNLWWQELFTHWGRLVFVSLLYSIVTFWNFPTWCSVLFDWVTVLRRDIVPGNLKIKFSITSCMTTKIY